MVIDSDLIINFICLLAIEVCHVCGIGSNSELVLGCLFDCLVVKIVCPTRTNTSWGRNRILWCYITTIIANYYVGGLSTVLRWNRLHRRTNSIDNG